MHIVGNSREETQMRLINTRTGLLEDFIGDEIPEYAILSHTWEKDEISFQEYQRLTDPDLAHDRKTCIGKAKAGFIKIRGCVGLAESKGFQYVWIDTCCIDKTSSADLTESINSMYQWYASSKICFAYLADVEEEEAWLCIQRSGEDWPEDCWAGEKSRWFTRGWTLQELIAPSELEFYSHSWNSLGNKKDTDIISVISKITGIEEVVLENDDLSSACVAQKMSWASRRKTTRKEDMAYCLLGLFDINMPLLYGEGEKAFLRLQEQIAASSTDHSLFAWGTRGEVLTENSFNKRTHRSIFARSPADFGECGELESQVIVHPDAWTQTNRGFHAVFPTIAAPLVKHLFDEIDGFPDYIDDKDYLAILNCYEKRKYYYDPLRIIGIWISLIDLREDGKDGFCRVTDLTTFPLQLEVSKLIGSSPDKFRKDLWFTKTSSTIRVLRDYFPKRFYGFLVPIRSSWQCVTVEVHPVYNNQVNGKMNMVSCPLLPLRTSGGLVGVVVVRCEVNLNNGTSQKDKAAIIFGYPPSSTDPFARTVQYSDNEVPLGYNLEKYGNGDKNDEHEAGLFSVKLSLCTVLYQDMLFTKLDIDLNIYFVKN